MESEGSPPLALASGDYVMLEIEDTGVGIDEAIRDQIFEPFFTTKSRSKGSGLGLSTVYGIVRQTGGFLSVSSSTEPPTGTTFYIYLPRHHGEAAQTDAGGEPAEISDLTGAGTVLLVEDEDPVRLFSARALRNKGYKVLEARTGEAALELIGNLAVEQDAIDLVITDVVMPKMDGPTLIGHAREKLPGVRVLCISGYAEEALSERIKKAGDVHFLSKPFTLKQLAGKVKDVMSSPTRQ